MLQVNLVIEDAKISLDELQEEIAEIEEYVQSSDVAGESPIHFVGPPRTALTSLSHAKALDDRFIGSESTDTVMICIHCNSLLRACPSSRCHIIGFIDETAFSSILSPTTAREK